MKIPQKVRQSTQNLPLSRNKLPPLQIFNLIYALIFIIFTYIKVIQGSLLERLSKFHP